MKKYYSNFNCYDFSKRVFDVLLSVTLIFLLVPLLIIISCTICIESSGPVFYSRIRLGRNGKPFGYLKFRTMKINSEKSATGPVFDLRFDDRIGKVGRFLRMSGLDELPSLFNVLRGEMSFVGPRAALPLEAAHYSAMQARRLELKPGITGYWQVFGRDAGAFDLEKMIKMDNDYAEKRSLVLDVRIIFRTLIIMFSKEAAY